MRDRLRDVRGGAAMLPLGGLATRSPRGASRSTFLLHLLPWAIGLASLAAILAVHDAISAWQRQKNLRGAPGVRNGAPAGQPSRREDLGLRFVAYFDEDPGGGAPSDAYSIRGRSADDQEWTRYPVVESASCRKEDVLRFVLAHGGQVDKVAFRQFVLPGGGQRRGLAAARNVKEGDEALSVPLVVSMSLHTALEAPDLGAELTQLVKNGTLDEFSALASFILHEAAKQKSFFRPFLCSLPRRVPLPIFDGVHELAARAGGNETKYLRAVAAIGRVLRDSYLKTSAALMSRRADLFPGVDDLRAWLWAGAIILSRSWGVAVPEKSKVLLLNGGSPHVSNITRMHVLAPVADMVNHDDKMRKVTYDSSRKGVVRVKSAQGDEGRGEERKDMAGSVIVHAGKTLRPGDEVTISYGDKCNMELSAHYGFSDPANSRLKCEWDSAVARLCFDKRVSGRCW